MRAKFDWHAAHLDDDTVIDGDYRNTQNVRRYFKSALGDDFSFNRPFMAWIKDNPGKTLAEACTVWRAMREETGI